VFDGSVSPKNVAKVLKLTDGAVFHQNEGPPVGTDCFWKERVSLDLGVFGFEMATIQPLNWLTRARRPNEP
jgi:hypothetical protein